jgi:hypothetical protein
MKVVRETGTVIQKSEDGSYNLLSNFIGTRNVFEYEGEMVHFEPWDAFGDFIFRDIMIEATNK